MRIIVLLIGLIFGSFGSVILTRLSGDRFDRKEIRSFVLGRSHCPKCKKTLRVTNLIPLLSYILQSGKCDFCKKKISLFYPMIELLSGLVFLLTYFLFPHSNYLILSFRLLTNRSLLIIIIYDFTKYELHIPIIVFGLIISLFPQFLNLVGDYKIAFWSSISLFLTFLLIYYLSKLYVKYRYKKDFEGMGFGDVILSFLIGTLFPFVFIFNNINFNLINLIKIILIFVLMSSLIGILIRIIKMLSKVASDGSKNIKNSLNIGSQNIIPFLPAMIITYRVLLFGSEFILNIIFG